MHNTCVTIFEFFYPFVDTPLQQTLFPYCAESLQWILAPDTPSDHKKRITGRCSSLVQMESAAAMVNVTIEIKELT